MKIEELTSEQKNTFWDKLIGNHRHEWKITPCLGKWKCDCGEVFYSKLIPPDRYPNFDYYRNLSGFQTIKEWMEKEMAEVWECYLRWCYDYSPHEGSIWDLTPVLNSILSLDNLLTYLLQPEVVKEWEYMGGKCEISACPTLSTIDMIFTCSKYDKGICSGKVKHPALLFAEGKEER